MLAMFSRDPICCQDWKARKDKYHFQVLQSPPEKKIGQGSRGTLANFSLFLHADPVAMRCCAQHLP